MVVIGGCERSGTTLMRAALDSHGQIAGGPESWVFVFKLDLPFLAQEYDISLDELQRMRGASSCLAEFIDRFSDWYCREQGKPVWCEKSPQNIQRLDYIWDHFPNARVIHAVRDGRDVVCSLRHHPRHRRVNGRYEPTGITNPVKACVRKWVVAARSGLEHRGDERYMEVRYEDLIENYEGTMRRVCDHCRIEWDDRLLDREVVQQRKQSAEIVNPEVRQPLYQAAIGRWRRDLSEQEQQLVMAEAGELLRAYGYVDGASSALQRDGSEADG